MMLRRPSTTLFFSTVSVFVLSGSGPSSCSSAPTRPTPTPKFEATTPNQPDRSGARGDFSTRSEVRRCTSCRSSSANSQLGGLREVSYRLNQQPNGQQDPCEGLPVNVATGCRKVMEQGVVPTDAFAWTMDAYRKNLGRLTTGRCMGKFSNGKCSSEKDGNVTREDYQKIFGGIKNQCYVIVNDVRPEKATGLLAPHYFIDLCQGKVVKDKVRLGEGTFRHNYANKEGLKTTLTGAFMVVPKTFPYKGRSHIGATLIGMQNTNNNSGLHCKYLHETHLDYSWGCPSLSETYNRTHNVIQKMTQSPSLLVNYGPPSAMEDIDDCGGTRTASYRGDL